MPKLRSARILAAIFICTPFAVNAEGVAITFDDLPLNGPLAPNTSYVNLLRDVLKILKRHRAPPVYGFVTAKKLEGNQDGAEALKLWVAGGERLGNHTYSHFDLNKETVDSFMDDVRRNEPVLELLDNKETWHWFRYPFLREGDTLEKRRTVRMLLRERGYKIAQVTLDYEDYLWNSAYARCVSKADIQSIAWLRSSYLSIASQYLDAERLLATTVYGREISHVLLLHLGAFTVSILPDLLDLLRQKGFTLVTLEEAQKDPAYDGDPDAAAQQGGTLLEQWMDVRGDKYPPIPAKPYKELAAICS